MNREKQSELLRIPVDSISRNPENPRLLFYQDKLDILAKSINEEGILVPLIMFEETAGKYVLLDGERRWLCAKRLNLKDVPANIIAKPNKIANILRMFNIHNVREDWELMPTALKLNELMKHLPGKTEREINELTSLTPGTIRRCQVLIDLPKKYQDALLKHEFKPDFFIEMDMKALRKIKSETPALYEKYGKEGLIDLFVRMQNDGKIDSVTDFRLLQPVLQGEKFGLPRERVQDMAQRIIVEQTLGMREAHDMIRGSIDANKTEASIKRVIETISNLSARGLKKAEKIRLKATLNDLLTETRKALRRL